MTRKRHPAPPIPELAADGLAADVAAFLVEQAGGPPFDSRAGRADEARLTAGRLVQAVAAIVAAQGHDGLAVAIRKVEHDGARIRVTLEAGREEAARHRLFDAAGGDGFLVLAEAGRFAGGA